MDIWGCAAEGDLEGLTEHLRSGAEVNAYGFATSKEGILQCLYRRPPTDRHPQRIGLRPTDGPQVPSSPPRGGPVDAELLAPPVGSGTALHYACVAGHAGMVRLLLLRGADQGLWVPEEPLPSNRDALLTPDVVAHLCGFYQGEYELDPQAWTRRKPLRTLREAEEEARMKVESQAKLRRQIITLEEAVDVTIMMVEREEEGYRQALRCAEVEANPLRRRVLAAAHAMEDQEEIVREAIAAEETAARFGHAAAYHVPHTTVRCSLRDGGLVTTHRVHVPLTMTAGALADAFERAFEQRLALSFRCLVADCPPPPAPTTIGVQQTSPTRAVSSPVATESSFSPTKDSFALRREPLRQLQALRHPSPSQHQVPAPLPKAKEAYRTVALTPKTLHLLWKLQPPVLMAKALYPGMALEAPPATKVARLAALKASTSHGEDHEHRRNILEERLFNLQVEAYVGATDKWRGPRKLTLDEQEDSVERLYAPYVEQAGHMRQEAAVTMQAVLDRLHGKRSAATCRNDRTPQEERIVARVYDDALVLAADRRRDMEEHWAVSYGSPYKLEASEQWAMVHRLCATPQHRRDVIAKAEERAYGFPVSGPRLRPRAVKEMVDRHLHAEVTKRTELRDSLSERHTFQPSPGKRLTSTQLRDLHGRLTISSGPV